jgi:hypothetical protein
VPAAVPALVVLLEVSAALAVAVLADAFGEEEAVVSVFVVPLGLSP